MMSSIKVGVIIPDRGDRPELMSNCIKMLSNQTLPHTFIWGIGMTAIPASEDCDISLRYKNGYLLLSMVPCDVIVFLENDDYYAPDYIETMVSEWIKAGRPDLFGTNSTIYYHLKLKKKFTMLHGERSSAMNTLIKPGLDIVWPEYNDPFTDQWLWMHPEHKIKNQVLIGPDRVISIGMKHGVGKLGAGSHIDDLHRYTEDDSEMEWLKRHTDQNSFNFYKEYSKKLNS